MLDGITLKVSVVFTLKFYGDESADETRSRVFTVAGVFGTEDEWAIAIRQWLRITRGRKFHAKDWESAHGRTPEQHAASLDLYKALTISLAESYLVGMAIALDLTSLRKHLPDVPLETAYCKCFTDVLRYTGGMARKQAGEGRSASFEYVFDSRLETDGTASQIYQSFRTLPEWNGTDIFDANVVFEGGDEPRLEMADLFAREAMKELDRTITGIPSRRRRSYETLDTATLAGTKKFHFIQYQDEYCAEWRSTVDGPQGQRDRREYEKWLAENGCIQNGHIYDTIANRARFYNWLENKEAFSKEKSS
jgi:hypothetical protein